VNNAKAKFQKRARAAFEERLAAQRAASAREAEPETDPAPESSPAPAARWEKWGDGFRRVTTSMTGTDPVIDKVMAEKHGHRLPSAEHVRAAEERLRDQLAHTGTHTKKVPVHQRPDPVERAVCPVDALLLQVVSYDAGGRPAERRCPACGRSEREFTEKGVSLESPTEALRASMESGGIVKKPVRSAVEEHVRGLTRRWV
jgi:hypothetical protein